MATVRFLSPGSPGLELRAVPALFVDGVFDMDDTDQAALGRMRYLGAPYGVVEIGAPTRENPALTEFEMVQGINDPASRIGQALRNNFLAKN